MPRAWPPPWPRRPERPPTPSPPCNSVVGAQRPARCRAGRFASGSSVAASRHSTQPVKLACPAHTPVVGGCGRNRIPGIKATKQSWLMHYRGRQMKTDESHLNSSVQYRNQPVMACPAHPFAPTAPELSGQAAVHCMSVARPGTPCRPGPLPTVSQPCSHPVFRGAISGLFSSSSLPPSLAPRRCTASSHFLARAPHRARSRRGVAA